MSALDPRQQACRARATGRTGCCCCWDERCVGCVLQEVVLLLLFIGLAGMLVGRCVAGGTRLCWGPSARAVWSHMHHGT